MNKGFELIEASEINVNPNDINMIQTAPMIYRQLWEAPYLSEASVRLVGNKRLDSSTTL